VAHGGEFGPPDEKSPNPPILFPFLAPGPPPPLPPPLQINIIFDSKSKLA